MTAFAKMLDIGTVVEAPARTTIIAQDDTDKDVYLLITGRLSVLHTSVYGDTTQINEIVAGEFFGEMSLFSNNPRSSTVSTTRNSMLLKFDGERFKTLLDSDARLVKYIGTTLIRRLSQSNEESKKR